jgi:hypothetical protein
MTRTLLVLGITLAAALPANADITHKIQSSIQLQVDGAASQASRIGSFSYSESYIEGDATPTATSVSSGVVTSLPMLGNTTTTSGGVAGNLAGTIASDGAMTITAGGAGTTATGQVVLSLEIE